LEEGAFASSRTIVETLESAGVSARHIFWPGVVLAYGPNGTAAALRALPGIRDVRTERLDLATGLALSKTEEAGIDAWNRCFASDRLESAPLPDPAGSYRPKGDLALHPPAPATARPAPRGTSSLPYGADFYDTSEFLIGTVAVGVVFIESDGTIDPSTENWTQTDEDFVFSEIVQGCNEWAAASTFALTFVYQSEDSVLTGYEPINRFVSQDALWLQQIMTTLGYPGANQFETTRAYINDLRDTFDTDWALVTFQVDATNDADGVFADGFIGGYSYFGGPYNHVAYDDAAGAIPHDDLCAHEFGHTFYALDEYASAQVPCTARAGYLNNENQNSEYPAGQCNLNAVCRMRLAAPNLLCTPSKRQVGWQDGDGDGIPLILDTDPETVLNDGVVMGSTVDYTGTADVNPRINANPYGQQHDISLNTLTDVQFRIDGGAWMATTPADGAFDEGSEAYLFTTTTLTPGGHLVETRAVSSVGNTDQTFASDSVTIQSTGVPVPTEAASATSGISLRPNPTTSSVAIAFRVQNDGAPAEVRVHDTQGRLVWSHVEPNPVGETVVMWDGVATSGRRPSPGVYFITVRLEGHEMTRELVLLR